MSPPDFSERFVWFDGRVMPESEARLAAESKGVMYGAGCFETVRAARSRFLQLERHLERLKKGVSWLGSGRLEELTREELAEWIHQLLEKNGLKERDALVRIQASLGGGRGYRTDSEEQVYLLISADPF